MAKTLRYTEATSNNNFREVAQNLQTSLVDCAMSSAGLAIKAGGSAVVKSVNTVNAFINGVLVTKAAADMAALVGTIPTTKFGLFVFTLQADGTLTTRAGTLNGAAMANLVFPEIPEGEVVIGFIVVENGAAGNFVGGTTALDAANVTVTYFDTPFPFNPNALTL